MLPKSKEFCASTLGSTYLTSHQSDHPLYQLLQAQLVEDDVSLQAIGNYFKSMWCQPELEIASLASKRVENLLRAHQPVWGSDRFPVMFSRTVDAHMFAYQACVLFLVKHASQRVSPVHNLSGPCFEVA